MLRLLLSLLVAGTVIALPAQAAVAQQVPATPPPVAVTLDAASTALLVLDVTTQTCSSPNCVEFIPRLVSLLSNARAAGAYVVYSVPSSQPPILTEVAPMQGDPVVVGYGQDRFFDTPLDEMLRAKDISNLILVGWRENGSVLYTAVGGSLRSYTVVVADDATSAAQDYDVAIGRYQLLTQLNANANNDPLKKAAVTLSRTDLISFQ